MAEYRIFSFPFSAEIDALAEQYIRRGIILEKYRDDALHIAAATIGGLSNLRKKQDTRSANGPAGDV
jgi:hypothetical protein